jgi:formylglycine-generating enzyme required for sulfatase activity
MKNAVVRLTFALLFLVAAGRLWCGRPAEAPAAEPAATVPAASAAAPAVPSITNSIGIKLVKIPAGEFMMGNLEPIDQLRKDYPLYNDKIPPEESRFDEIKDESPAHRVHITKPFYMGACTVTLGQFRQFIDATHYATDAERNDEISSPAGSSPRRSGAGGYGYNKETGKLDEERNPKFNWRDVGFPQTENHPVTNVSWNDAVKFCHWLSEKEQKTYRLPTEAEWEYCCRAGTKTRFWSGDDPESLVKIANTYDKSTSRIQPEWAKFALKGNDGFEFTAPVGSFPPNAFGLYDMHGNVWQWTSDFYAKDYYANSPVDDPQGPATGGRHVRRGGGWATWSFYCRSSFRNFNTPQSRYYNLGFRVVMEDKN